ncbi:hypothetical protein HDU67_008999, partial [Dinochytrium kinnereticum]
KSTLLKQLFCKYPDSFGFSVSHTTRNPRPGEEDGKAYHFVSREKFTELVEANAFIENAEFSGNMYGTSFETVKRVQDQNKICVLDVEITGVKNIKQSDLKAVFIFIRPPSIDDLEKRLRGRGTETEESLAKRLGAAQAELEYAETGAHDKIIVNDSEERAFQELDEFVRSKWPHVIQEAIPEASESHPPAEVTAPPESPAPADASATEPVVGVSHVVPAVDAALETVAVPDAEAPPASADLVTPEPAEVAQAPVLEAGKKEDAASETGLGVKDEAKKTTEKKSKACYIL